MKKMSVKIIKAPGTVTIFKVKMILKILDHGFLKSLITIHVRIRMSN
jgi:hypothetical protein